MRKLSANRLGPYLTNKGAPAPAPEIEPLSWREMAQSWEQRCESFLGEHPKLTVAAAAAVGLMLGWMVKRK